MAQIIDGKKLAETFRSQTTQEVQKLKTLGITPGLAFVLIGSHPASQVYVKNKQKACDAVGIHNILKTFPLDVTEEILIKTIQALNHDSSVHGILVQLPLPEHFNTKKILQTIDPKKDVDGLHPDNMGRLFLKIPGLKPCTPQGVVAMIESVLPNIRGLDACVVGRSAIVGRPTAILLAQRDTTLTLCHRYTQHLEEKIAAADILVVAIGQPQFIRGKWIKKGAVVIDVGINRLAEGRIVGDVDFESAKERAYAISPVPGGVGPMTIAMLMKNTVEACKNYETDTFTSRAR